MNNSKTLGFKIATTIIFAVFVAVCLTAGIVYAAFAVPVSTTASNVPTARLYSELWGTASGGSPLTSIPANQTVYVSTTSTSGDATNVTVPYCVMRVAVSPTVSTPSDISSLFTFATPADWTLQDNGWYYYNKVVGNSATDRINVGTASVACHMVVELMQFASQSDGFAELWSPLAGRDATTNISSTSTTDGVAISQTAWMGNGRFVPYNGNNKQFTTHSATAGSVNISDVLTTDVISTAVSESTTLPINSLNTSINTDYLRIYNNSIVPGAFLMQVTPYVVSVSGSAGNYTSDLRSQNIAISSLSFNFGNDTSNLVFGTYQNGSLFMISNGAVMPGEYLNTLPDSITFTLADDINGTASSLYAIYLNIYIHLIDVDTLEYTMTEIEGGNDTVLNAGFAGYYDIWSTDTALKTNLKSKYYTWLDALEANLAGTGLGMPAYTKLQESLDTQTVNTYSL